MKKILLSLLCLSLFSGISAQSLTLLDTNGVVINPGATVQVIGDPTDDVIQAVVFVKNTSDVAKRVKVKKMINAGDTLPGTVNTFCWGMCFPPSTYVSPNNQNIQPGDTCREFYGDYNPVTVIGISRITYVFFDMDNTDDSVAVKVEYNASPEFISDDLISLVKFSGAYPNPATDVVSVDYTIPEFAGNASVIVTNILGSRVSEISLNGLSGTVRIPVSDLINGIYFYSLVADDQLLLTRKFVVKR